MKIFGVISYCYISNAIFINQTIKAQDHYHLKGVFLYMDLQMQRYMLLSEKNCQLFCQRNKFYIQTVTKIRLNSPLFISLAFEEIDKNQNYLTKFRKNIIIVESVHPSVCGKSLYRMFFNISKQIIQVDIKVKKQLMQLLIQWDIFRQRFMTSGSNQYR